jgi:hypothetical protein
MLDLSNIRSIPHIAASTMARDRSIRWTGMREYRAETGWAGEVGLVERDRGGVRRKAGSGASIVLKYASVYVPPYYSVTKVICPFCPRSMSASDLLQTSL